MPKRALSINDIYNSRFQKMYFENEYKDSFGTPERAGVWICWGQSGHGKTRFMLKLAKYLTNYGRVAYDTLEEGLSLSFQKACIDSNMNQVRKGSFIILDREPIEELKLRLRKKRSPDIIIIDSFQYTGMSKKEYKELKEEFNNKLFIFVSHASGRLPEGKVADFVRYDSDIKIYIEGYKAFPKSRMGGSKEFIIWQQGAMDYWGLKTSKNE